MKVSDHFVLQEFIDPITYSELGEKAIDKIDRKLIDIAELLRELTGCPVIINNWHTHGQYKESGLRRLDSPTGAKKSAHKEGKAIDCKVVGMTISDVYMLVMQNEKKFYSLGVRQIENIAFTPSWVHIGTRGVDNEQNKIQIINP